MARKRTVPTSPAHAAKMAGDRAYYEAHRFAITTFRNSPEGRIHYAAVRKRYADAHRAEIYAYEKSKRDDRLTSDRFRRYGVTREYVEEMLSAQEWCCAICGDEIGLRAHFDHDHETGEHRGMLCKQCNMALGLLKDIEGLGRAIDYLKDYSVAS